MIKGVFKKTLICILIFVIMFNFGITSITQATNTTNTTNSTNTTMSAEEAEALDNEKSEKASTGLGGILLAAARGAVFVVCNGFNMITRSIAISAGQTDSEEVAEFITPFDIIFNRFVLTDINVFSLDGLDPDGMVATIRESISMFFVVMTGISIGMLLIVLVVFVIQFALESDVATRRAKIKNALWDWLASVLAVILMDAIVMLVIFMNNQMVDAIKGNVAADVSTSLNAIEDVILSADTGIILGIGALITYVALTWQTFKFLWKYISRFFTVALLIIIAPLAPVPYALSKMKSRDASTSLWSWLGEFINAVCTQLVHCLIYSTLVAASFKALALNPEIKGVAALAPAIFSVFAMSFIGPAEHIIRSIFKVKSAKGGFIRTLGGIAEGSKEVNAILTNKSYTPPAEREGDTGIFGGFFASNIDRARQTITGQDPTKIHYNNRAGDGADNPAVLRDGADNPTGLEGRNPTDGSGLGECDSADAVPVDELTPEQRRRMDEVVAGTHTREGTDGVDGVDAVGADGADGLAGDVVVATATSSVTTTEDNETTEEIREETVVAVPEDEKKMQALKDYLAEKLKVESDRIIESVSNIKITDENREELEAKFKEIFEPIQADIKKMLEDAKGDQETFFRKVQEKYQGDTQHYDYAKAFAMSLMAEAKPGDSKDKPKDSEVDGDSLDEQAREHLAGINDSTMDFLKQNIASALSDNPDLRDQFIEIINKRNALVGKAEIESDTSDELLAEMSVDIIKSEKLSSMDNYEEALAKVKEGGDAAMAELESARKNGINDSTSDSVRRVVEFEKAAEQAAAARGLAVKVLKNTSSGTSTDSSDTSMHTVHKPSEATEAVLDAINKGKPKDAQSGTSN